jgi:hypothetical protein
VFFCAWHCVFGAPGAFMSVAGDFLDVAHVVSCRGVASGMRCQSATWLGGKR